MAKKSPELNFSFNVSEPFIKECATFLNLPSDDALVRTSSQLFASNFSLSNDLTISIGNLSASINNFTTRVNEQWTTLQTTTLQTLNTTVLTVGQVSSYQQDISSNLKKSNENYEKSVASNQLLEQSLTNLQNLYQANLIDYQRLNDSYLSCMKDNLQLQKNLDSVILMLKEEEKVKSSRATGFTRSMTELSNSSQEIRREILPYLQRLEQNLKHSQNQESSLLRMKNEIVPQLKNQVDMMSQPINDAVMMLEIARKETKDTLFNFQAAFIGFVLSTLLLLGFNVWNLSAHAATAATNISNINSFGGETYHRVALRIMDSKYRDENLKRLENCREKNKKIKSPIMECYLKVERS